MTRPSPTRLLAGALSLAIAACSPSPDKEAAIPNPTGPAAAAETPLVRVTRLEQRPVRRTIETTSYLESEHRVMVQSKVAGRVVAVHVDEGAVVTAGTLLASLDDREAMSALRQAEVLLQDRKVRFELAGLEAEVAAHGTRPPRSTSETSRSTPD